MRRAKQKASPFGLALCARHVDLSTRLSAITPAPQRGEGVNGQAYGQSSYCRPFTSPPFLLRMVADGRPASQGLRRTIHEISERSALTRCHSALSTQHSALGTRHSALGTSERSRDPGGLRGPRSDRGKGTSHREGAPHARGPCRQGAPHRHQLPCQSPGRSPRGGPG